MKVTLKKEWLKAIEMFAAKKDVREYLNSVYFDETNVVATDGHRLCCLKHSAEDELSGLKFIVPIEVIKQALKLKSNFITFEFNGDVCTINDSILCKRIDMKYPEYQHAIPKKTSEGIKLTDEGKIPFNIRYLHDAQIALSVFSGNKLGVLSSKCWMDSPHTGCLFEEGVLQVVVMPTRV